MSIKLPIISIIITNFNYAEYVAQAIQSVINQTYKNIELIIIDDGSTDNSRAIIEKYVKRYPHIKYISQKNHGVVYTRNKGMELATGEFLCCLDADDFFDKDYIEKQYKYITKHGADVVYPNWNLIGDINQKMYFPEFDFIEYQKQHLHIKPESLIRTSAIKNKDGTLRLGYLPETKERANDWAYFISLAANGLKFKLAKDNFVNYRIKKGSMGNRFSKYEEIKIFYGYLDMLKRMYGDKIIEPIELPLDIIEQQDERIEINKEIISRKDHQIEDIENINREITEKNSNLEQEIGHVYNSFSWKVTRPLRLVNRIARKLNH